MNLFYPIRIMASTAASALHQHLHPHSICQLNSKTYPLSPSLLWHWYYSVNYFCLWPLSRTKCVSQHQNGKTTRRWGGSHISWTICRSSASHSRQPRQYHIT